MVGFRADVPFPAIVGQDRLKRALLVVAVNDALDGLLIRGEKGTAKSTAVRGLVDLLPSQQAVADCPYGCPPDEPAKQCETCRSREDLPLEGRPVPLVTVPLGATRERVVGSLSLSDALEGEPTFEPGLLAQANRGILYVDEVNLLEDHLVDVLLDAAASGRNRVERDGVSETHPADFTLVGTMNPEEGDLRPQLRDRFALQVEVAGSEDLTERVAIVESALQRDAGADLEAEHAATVESLRQRIERARERLPSVRLPRELAERIGRVCVDAGVDGHRGDIAAARAARTLAALDGRDAVSEDDIESALRFALAHRLQSRPFEETTPLEDVLQEHFGEEDSPQDDQEGGDESTDGVDEAQDSEGSGEGEKSDPNAGGTRTPEERGSSVDSASGEEPPERSAERDGPEPGPTEADAGASGGPGRKSSLEEPNKSEPSSVSEENGGDQEGGESDDAGGRQSARPPAQSARRSAPPAKSDAPTIDLDSEPGAIEDRAGDGRAMVEPSVDRDGPRLRTEPAESAETVDVAASVREAARHGESDLQRRDLRQSVRAGSASALVVFAVDASASMRPAMRAAKGTVLALLKESYAERDEVAFVAFAGEDASVLLPPTDSVTLAARHLKELPAGDRTPLPAGLETAAEVIERADPAASVAVVVTDGRPNVADGSPTAATREAASALGRAAEEVLVVDASQPDDRADLIEELLAAAEARSIPLEELSEESVHAAARSVRE